jgi:hypothetical protein
MPQSARVVPEQVEDLRRRLEQWRSTHKRRGRIPGSLWGEAAELVRRHGVYQTAKRVQLGASTLSATAATLATCQESVELWRRV